MTFYGDIYRPTNEKQLIGESQQKIWKSLKDNFDKGNIYNKLMFLGDYGLGKTTLAEMYIRLILQLEPDDSLDDKIVRINCGDNTGVDFYRSIIDRLHRRNLNCKYNVYFLDEVHKLSKSALDVWLTPLESLPEYTIVIFATTNPEKLNKGLKSRFEKLHLKTPSNSEFKRKAQMVINHQKSLGHDISITENDIDEVIQLSKGSVREFDSYLQSKIEGRFNELDEAKENKLVIELIYGLKQNNLEEKTKFVFNEIKELEINYTSFTNMACRSVISMLRDGKVKGNSLKRAYIFLECFGDGLNPDVDIYVSFHTQMKRFLERS